MLLQSGAGNHLSFLFIYIAARAEEQRSDHAFTRFVSLLIVFAVLVVAIV